MPQYKVSKHHGILVGGTMIQPETLIDSADFKPEQVKEWLKQGFIVKEGAADHGNDPGVKPAPANVDLSKDRGNKQETLNITGKQSDENKDKLDKLQHTGKWDRNPEDLKNYTIEELNTLIIEIDHTIKPYGTKKEAIAQLSLDYVPPKK